MPCAGDFNEIRSIYEKHGGAIRPTWQINTFNEAIQDCDLHEIPFMGPVVTWMRCDEIFLKSLIEGWLLLIFEPLLTYSLIFQ